MSSRTSGADPELAQQVLPVPEELLENRNVKDRHTLSVGHRAVTRLQQHERLLAQYSEPKKWATGKVDLGWRPPMRRPAPAEITSIKAKIPAVLRPFDSRSRASSGQEWSGSEASRSKSGYGRSRPASALGNISNTTHQTGSTSMYSSRRPISAPSSRPGDTTIGAQSSLQQTMVDMAGTCSTADYPLGKTQSSSSSSMAPRHIKYLSPTEKIGCLMSPYAQVRSGMRNSKMSSSRRHTSYIGGQPPPVIPEGDPGHTNVFGKDPLLSHFLPLELYDNEELDIYTPAEWISLGCATGGTLASSKYQNESGEAVWAECTLHDYNEERNEWLIRWAETGKEKWVKRLNLLFHQEDPDAWQLRVEEAMAYRAEAEAELRMWMYVNSQPSEQVTPMDEYQVRRILSLVASEMPQEHIHIIDKSLSEMHKAYLYGVKRAIFEYSCQDKVERDRLGQIITATLKPPPPPPLKGTIDIPPHNFVAVRRFIEENLFFTHHLLYGTIYSIIGRWEAFAEQALVDVELKGIQLPCELEVFQAHQLCVAKEATVRLQEEWSVNITCSIQRDLDEYFNFYEDNLQRFLSSRLSRFFRTINLIMSHQLRSLMSASVDSYVRFIENYDCKETVSHFDLTETALALSGNVPLLVIRLTGSGNCVAFQPPLEDVIEVVHNVLTDIFVQTENIAGVGDTLFPLLNLGKFYLRTLAADDPSVVEGKMNIDSVLQKNMEGPKALKALYNEFEYLTYSTIEDYLEEFSGNNPSLEDYNIAIQKLYDDIERIQTRSLNEVSFELVKVECYKVKATLIQKANDLAQALLTQLSARTNEDTAKVAEAYEEIYQQIQVDPCTPEELRDMQKYVEQCRIKLILLQSQFDNISEARTLLSKFGFMTDEEDFNQYWATFSWPKRVVSVLESSQFRNQQCRNQFMQQLRDDTHLLTDGISQLSVDVEVFATFEDEQKIDEYWLKLKGMNEKIEHYKEQIHICNDRESFFGLSKTQYSHLNEIVKTFEPYRQLWTIVYDFSQQYHQWHEGLFIQLDPDVIENNVQNWSKTLHRLCKSLKDEAPGMVAVSMKDKLDLFRPHIPLIWALSNPGLRDRHWKSISKVCNQTVKMAEDTTFNHLLGLRLQEHLMEIQEISEYASKEYRLEKQLEKMQGEWKSLQFGLVPYNDTYLLKSVDGIQQLLDDQIIKTQTMLGSPFVKAIQPQVKSWETKLLRIQLILEEWIKCQSVWQYLEPIFTSPDIQKNLPNESQKFQFVNTLWQSTMEVTIKNPYVIQRCQEERILPHFIEANRALEAVLKVLHQWLETKRVIFPRFYFLSNEELLEILAETKNPIRVQPHLKKLFEGIQRLKFESDLDITSMFSAEMEEVPLHKAVNPTNHNNAVEMWLTELETVMRHTILMEIRDSVEAYAADPSLREEWLLEWPGQVILCVSQIFWTREMEEKIQHAGVGGIVKVAEQLQIQMKRLIEMVRGDLKPVERCTLEALVVLEVNNRDTTCDMSLEDSVDTSSFTWLSQMRYYLDSQNASRVVVKQLNAQVEYGYEYLGNTPRLVITPLTERCYRTLIGAIHLNLGGAPEGPAGTGKTETTKDLAKALAKHCVVYNCSDQISYREMAKLFKGLASGGAWACFDEFNRIEIQVLSVVAQQVASIQMAVAEQRIEFLFEGALVKLKQGCSIFITMNPGYAGRAELPDNLKSLFRPVAMMIPEYAMIAEISLFSYGFLIGRSLAQKIVATYRLCSEQLSSQDHYDYGMRAVKTVLTAAGRLKRKFPDDDEQAIMLQAIMDINLPKFVAQDTPLFQGIVADLFPGVLVPTPDYSALIKAMDSVCRNANLEMVDAFVTKIQQLYEMLNARHGVMIVGLSYAGKSCALRVLQQTLTSLHRLNLESRTNAYYINPKAITMGQLFGQNDAALEWNDGVLSKIFRTCAHEETEDRQWIVLDGPVDAIWIENMNTVLDDNKKLCLLNGDMIAMTSSMNMIFEVQDLAVASPATVSRAGMVYMEPDDIGWRPLFDSWIRTMPTTILESHNRVQQIRTLFEVFLEPAMQFLQKSCKMIIPSMNRLGLVASCFRLLKSFLVFLDEEETEVAEGDAEDAEVDAIAIKNAREQELHKFVEGYFILSIVWSLGGILDSEGRRAFDQWFRHTVFTLQHEIKKKKGESEQMPTKIYSFQTTLPEKRTLYEFMYNREEKKFVDWMDTVKDYSVPAGAQFHEIIVPTADTVRYSHLLSVAVKHHLPLMLIGPTGTGKTIMVKELFNEDIETYVPIFLQFSAQTTANYTQDIIDSRLEKRRKGTYGPSQGRRALILIDDANMPDPDQYGSQPPIELLRQWLDYGGWYERKKDTVDFKEIQDVMLYCCMQPPGGGRSNLSSRFVRHFNAIYITPFDQVTMMKIFKTLLDHSLCRPGYGVWARPMGISIVTATLELYEVVSAQLLPTPQKSHYAFNLRDVSKVIQGISLASPQKIENDNQMCRLWVHECTRTFADRLVDDADRMCFRAATENIVKKVYRRDLAVVAPQEPLIFGDYMEHILEDRTYEEITDMDRARETIQEYLEYYNTLYTKKMDLVIFNYVVEHVSRLTRIIQQPYANALLIGMGGTGRQSCTRLAAHMADNRLFTLSPMKNYTMDAWNDDMRNLLKQTGWQGQPTVFLMTDTEIKDDAFLDDLSNILNSGEIPNLFPTDDINNITEGLKLLARDIGRDLNKSSLWNLFIDRTRTFLRIVLCFSPIGADLRSRLRKFPTLVNCCTIDWFSAWPDQALQSVADHYLKKVQFEEHKASVIAVFSHMHRSITEVATEFLQTTRQHVYVTPTAFLQLIALFTKIHAEKTSETTTLAKRYSLGLEQLNRTETEVEAMTLTLEELKPNLVKLGAQTDELITRIELESKDAEQTRVTVAVEEAACNTKAAAAKQIRDECEVQLEEAMPALEAATKAVSEISKKELAEIRFMQAPSEKIKRVIEAVLVCLEEQPKKIVDSHGKVTFDYWDVAKKRVMVDTTQFVNRLLDYDKDNIKESVIEKVQPYIKDRNFRPEVVKNLSKALVGLCQWVIALEKFYRVNKFVKPKKEMLETAEREYNQAMYDLKIKKEELALIDSELDKLKRVLRENTLKKKAYQDEYDLTEVKLKRATKLMDGLVGEKVRYVATSKELSQQSVTLLGDILISAGLVAYLGPFTNSYRQQLVDDWIPLCTRRGIRVSETYDMVSYFGDDVKIIEWRMHGLPADPFSINNALISKMSKRWPLFIDPQGQANNWIKRLEKPRKLVSMRTSEPDYEKTLMTCIRSGVPVLIEDIMESLDPILDPLLTHQIFKEQATGMLFITLGASTVEYNENFELYMTTKLPQPHFTPETSIKVTVINFMITPTGLQDQLLSKVVQHEEKDVEERMNNCVQDGANNKAKLKKTEDEILNLLSSGSDVLEDEGVINTLDNCKRLADEIATKQHEIDKIQRNCNRTRTKLIPVAHRASRLFFCFTELGNIDPMYQFSLQWFIELFQRSLRESEMNSQDRDQRMININTHFTYALYKNGSMSLFEKDRFLLSFTMAVKLMDVDPGDLRFFLTAGYDEGDEHIKSPVRWLPDAQYRLLLRLSKVPELEDIQDDFAIYQEQWKAFYLGSHPQDTPMPGICEHLDPFKKLLVLRLLRSDKLIPAVFKFVQEQLGPQFVETPILDLNTIYSESFDPCVPLIFILSSNSDPNAELLKLAENKGMATLMYTLSLGQGMGARAAEAIQTGKAQGNWVLLQNCHLYSDWMPSLERIVGDYMREGSESVHSRYRLWLTSKPSDKFPVALLQVGIKLNIEAPKGLKANLLRSYLSDPLNNKDFFKSCSKATEWKSLAFRLCLFHAVVQERRTFGPLGWNTPYEFNETDLRISLRQLMEHLNLYDEIPFEALTYLTGHCNYGGRVTDDWDRRTLMALLSDYYCEEMLSPGHNFSEDAAYTMPDDEHEWDHADYVQFIRSLPVAQSPQLFGLHPNGAIAKDERETRNLLDAMLITQPREGGHAVSGAVSEPSTQVSFFAQQTFDNLPEPFDVEVARTKWPYDEQQSMNTVLVQEMVRYNRLLAVISSSLEDIIKAASGMIVMSPILETVFSSIYDGKVPALWMAKSYPSQKSLAGYMKDFLARMTFFQEWNTHGPPNVFWLSGFFFTHSFLTGVLQNHSRKYQIEIDALKWNFGVTHITTTENISAPEDGCLVHGLFLEGASWGGTHIEEAIQGELFATMPLLWLIPTNDPPVRPTQYSCPLYKTSARRGQLATTGHSTNFVMAIDLPIPPETPSTHWIKRGTALLCSLDN